MIAETSVDLLYLACNRLEFTRETFATLIRNTDWRFVRQLFLYDDGSRDGTREWLERNCRAAPVPVRFEKTRFGSPVSAMVRFIESASAPILAKTDNDAMLPPDWLRQSLETLDHHPGLTLLGIEALYPHVDDPILARSYTPARFISGLGLYKRSAFARSRPRAFNKWFGLEEWQVRQGPGLTRGWITPALPVFLLDRFPFDPWLSYSAVYVRREWQRSWPKYPADCTLWKWRWPSPPFSPAGFGAEPPAPDSGDCDPAYGNSATRQPISRVVETPAVVGPSLVSHDFTIVILSARASNLVPCVRSILIREPGLSPEQILVVDDGAKADAHSQLPGVRWTSGIKPFIYARNANVGIRAAASDVILLNDDARLITPKGFSLLVERARKQPKIGICSAGIQGVVGNRNQLARKRGGEVRNEGRNLAFVCVFIPKCVFELIGPLDEQFVGYGCEDTDYCDRVRSSGLRLIVNDVCVVDHSGQLPSTFRTRPDVSALHRQNRELYRLKSERLRC